jgi:hypothetical protein
MASWELREGLGLNVSEEDIGQAVRREELSHRVAHVKPFLTEITGAQHLNFAEENLSLSGDTRGHVLWRDESAM